MDQQLHLASTENRASMAIQNRMARFRTRVKDSVEDIRFLGTHKRQAMYVGCLQDQNLGDEVLYQLIAQLFSRTLSFYPRIKPGPIAKRLWGKVNPAVVMLGGGTLIKKDEDLYLGRLNRHFDSFPKSLKITFGTGVADADMWSSFGIHTDTRGWREALTGCDYIGVRGPLSKAFLAEWGVEKNVNVIGDPAAWLTTPLVRAKSQSKKIGINFGPTHGYSYGRNDEALLQFAAGVLRVLAMEGWTITCFPMITADRTFMEAAIRQANTQNVNMHAGYSNIRWTLRALEEQDLFIGQKLHSVVFASCVSTPGVMIAYRSKCIDFMRSINREAWTMKTSELDVDAVLDKIKQLYSSLADHQTQVHSGMLALRCSLRDAIEHVERLIENS